MSIEKPYQPSEEEIENAEENMSDEQKEASELREEILTPKELTDEEIEKLASAVKAQEHVKNEYAKNLRAEGLSDEEVEAKLKEQGFVASEE